VEQQFGKFRLIRKIATGGMGEIFLARHVDQPENQPPVALKRILPHRAKDPRFVKVFFQEAKIIKELNHPNLVRVLDFGKEQDAFYMTMDFVDGVNLDAVLTAAPEAWPVACGVEIVRQALSGIGHAHARADKDGRKLNIVHLDLSPHNLMVDRNGAVRILDFGVSKAIYEEDHKAFNALRGTYAYMSPEQCREQEVDRRSDLFTLGILLYELTTLKPLFRVQPSEFMILKAITEGMIPPPTNALKEYPPALERVIFRALEVDPARRYQSADAFGQALKHVVDSLHLEHGPELLARAVAALPLDAAGKAEDAASASPTEFPPPTPVSNEPAPLEAALPAEPKTAAPRSEEAPADAPSPELPKSESAPAAATPANGPEATPAPKPAAPPTASPVSTPPGESSHRSMQSLLDDIGDTDAEEPEDDSSDLADELDHARKRPRRASLRLDTTADASPALAAARAQWRKRLIASFVGLAIAFLALFGALYHQKVSWITPTEGPAAYEAERGKLQVATIPEGATVFVDMKKQDGLTPLTLADVAFGQTLAIEVVLEGYEPVKRSMTLTDQRPLDAVFVELKKK